MMNIISGRLHTRADIWGNNVLVDNVASLYGMHYIFDKLNGLTAVTTF